MTNSNIATINFRLTGIPEINSILTQLADRHVTRITRNTNYQIAKYAQQQIKIAISSNVRRRTGKLKNAVRFKIAAKNSTDFVVYFQLKAFYWRFLDKGTPGKRASPFFKQAVDNVMTALPNLIRFNFKRELEKQIADELRFQARRRRR